MMGIWADVTAVFTPMDPANPGSSSSDGPVPDVVV